MCSTAYTTAVLQASCFFSAKFSSTTSLDCYYRLHFIRNSNHFRSKFLKIKTCVASEIARHQVADHDKVESGISSEMVARSNDHHKEDDGKVNDTEKRNKICDKLINIFMVEKPTPTDWRRLLAFSREWVNLRTDFYKRCHERASSEDDPGKKLQLLRLGRKLKEIDEDVQRHNELLGLIKKLQPELNEVVSRRRKDFTKEFFMHLNAVSQSYHDNPAEQNDLNDLIKRCLYAVQVHDADSESMEVLTPEELKFKDIFDSPLDVACQKIDTMADNNELDPASFQVFQKAWSTAKESNIVKEDAMEIMHHLYKGAVGNCQKNMPKEVRILKYLLIIRDLDELRCALNDAFTPGDEVEGKEVDMLCTTPEMLHSLLRLLIDAYNFSKSATIMREARDLMKPQLMQKMEDIKKMIEKSFM